MLDTFAVLSFYLLCYLLLSETTYLMPLNI